MLLLLHNAKIVHINYKEEQDAYEENQQEYSVEHEIHHVERMYLVYLVTEQEKRISPGLSFAQAVILSSMCQKWNTLKQSMATD